MAGIRATPASAGTAARSPVVFAALVVRPKRYNHQENHNQHNDNINRAHGTQLLLWISLFPIVCTSRLDAAQLLLYANNIAHDSQACQGGK